MLLRDTGYVELLALGSEAAYKLPLAEYEDVKRAWMKGEPFVEVVSWYGVVMTIKLSRIEAITKWTPEGLDLLYNERREQAKQDALHND